MKTILTATTLALIALSIARPAAAEESKKDAALHAADCSLLSGTPWICVENRTHSDITNIDCSGVFTSHLSLPGGSVRSGVLAVIKFDSGRCAKTITVNFSGRNPRVINGFDPEKNTVLQVYGDN